MKLFTELNDRAAEQLAGGAHVNEAAEDNGLSNADNNGFSDIGTFRIVSPGTSKFETGARVVYLPVTKGTAKKFG